MIEQEHGSVAMGDSGENAKLVELIKSRFLGVHPDDVDCYLEHDDWTRIIAALARPVQEPVARVSDYRKSDGTTDFYVMIGKGESAISLHMHKIRGRAEYEAAEINHALTGSPKPEFSDFDLDTPPAAPQPAHGTSATERVAEETCLWDCKDAPMEICPTSGKPCPAPNAVTAGQGVEVKPITLNALKDYFTAMSWGDVPDYPTALYSMLVMDGYISKASAATEVRAALATPTPKEESK